MLNTLSFGLIPAGAPLLPVAFALIMAFIILMYVILDGFDLGIGVLFAIERDPVRRDIMVNSIAPVWDGNETWLVLGGSTLYAAFPLAYAVVLPAVYPLIILMLMGLIFRGAAFEFRFRAPTARLRQDKQLSQFRFNPPGPVRAHWARPPYQTGSQDIAVAPRLCFARSAL